MAMSMEGLEIERAGISSVPTEVVNLQLVSRLEAQSTVGAAPTLPLEQGGQSRTDRGY